MLIIPNIVFVVLLAIATGYLTFLTTKGGLTDNRFSSLSKRFTKRGKTVIFILLCMAFLLILQELNNSASNNQKDKSLKRERGIRDSIITAGINTGVESNSKKLFDDISRAFNKQELRLDTLKKEVERVRDSAKNVTNNYSQPDPVLLLDSAGVTLTSKDNSKSHYKIAFKSSDAGSTNFNIMCYILTQYFNGTSDLSKINFFPPNLQIPKNAKWETGFNSTVVKSGNEIFFYLKGKYTTLDGLKTYYIDNVYSYDLNTNRVSVLLGNPRKKVVNNIKQISEDKLIVE